VVDAAALKRGAVDHGETCEIRGVGPISVPAARKLLPQAMLAAVVKDGIDIQNVTHVKRRTTAHQRTVLEYLGLTCSVEGCDRTTSRSTTRSPGRSPITPASTNSKPSAAATTTTRPAASNTTPASTTTSVNSR
jgi:hypothetical protein